MWQAVGVESLWGESNNRLMFYVKLLVASTPTKWYWRNSIWQVVVSFARKFESFTTEWTFERMKYVLRWTTINIILTLFITTLKVLQYICILGSHAYTPLAHWEIYGFSDSPLFNYFGCWIRVKKITRIVIKKFRIPIATNLVDPFPPA